MEWLEEVIAFHQYLYMGGFRTHYLGFIYSVFKSNFTRILGDNIYMGIGDNSMFIAGANSYNSDFIDSYTATFSRLLTVD